MTFFHYDYVSWPKFAMSDFRHNLMDRTGEYLRHFYIFEVIHSLFFSLTLFIITQKNCSFLHKMRSHAKTETDLAVFERIGGRVVRNGRVDSYLNSQKLEKLKNWSWMDRSKSKYMGWGCSGRRSFRSIISTWAFPGLGQRHNTGNGQKDFSSRHPGSRCHRRSTQNYIRQAVNAVKLHKSGGECGE